MASISRRADPPLEEALFDRAYEFEFFQAVRLLSRLSSHRKQVGGAAKPVDEIARFRGRVSLAFPPSAVDDIERDPDGGPASMTVAFVGLAGIQGVLPICYSERLIARKAAKDGAMAAFFDLFNHRFISLFYRAWEKHRPAVLYESAMVRGPVPDPFTHYLFDLIGMGTEGLRGRMRIPDQSLVLYAGLIAQRPHSASALRSILRDYFSVPVEIDQCVGSWYTLEHDDRCYLSQELERSELGEGAFIGDEVWNQQARFRIRVGPIGLDRFLGFLPGSPGMAELIELTRYLVGQAPAFEVQFILRAAEVPHCRLDDEDMAAPRLGWMGWLKTEEFRRDAGDAVFTYLN